MNLVKTRKPLRTLVDSALRTASCFVLTAFCLFLTTGDWPLTTATAHAQQTVDKMVATVNAGTQAGCDLCLITYSDLLWQLALQSKSTLDNPSSDELNRALRLIVDQRLILEEAEKLPSIEPSADEVKAARNEIAQTFPSAAEFQLRLQRVGLTADKLNQILEQRVRIEKYLDFRFRNFVVITPKEITDYYNDVYAPRFKGRQIVPTLEDSRAEIEKALTETKIESDMDTFLDNARERAEIVMLNPI
jgi:parvulin-like peptidyl-prolyl isomerase